MDENIKIKTKIKNKKCTGKYQLEETSFGVSTIKDIVKAVTVLQKLKEDSASWNAQWEDYDNAEKLILNNRFQLPPTWIRCSRVRGTLDDFFSVLSKRWATLETEATAIYEKLEDQFKVIVDDVQNLETRWHAEKPTGGWAGTWSDEECVEWLREYDGGSLRNVIENFRHKNVDGAYLQRIAKKEGRAIFGELERNLDLTDNETQERFVAAIRSLLFTFSDVEKRLSEFETSIAEIESNYAEVGTAKKAMSVVVDTSGSGDDFEVGRILDSVRKELEGLKEVHKALTEKWKELQAFGQQKFLTIDSRELGKTLRNMEEDLSKLPNKMRTYQVYHKFIEILKEKGRINKNVFIDLSSGVLRQKHWVKLLKTIGCNKTNPDSLLVADLWNGHIMKHINEIKGLFFFLLFFVLFFHLFFTFFLPFF